MILIYHQCYNIKKRIMKSNTANHMINKLCIKLIICKSKISILLYINYVLFILYNL